MMYTWEKALENKTVEELEMLEKQIAETSRLVNEYKIKSMVLEKIKSERKKVDEENKCVICMEERKELTFIPCGHHCCCKNCGSMISSCPMCRTDITSRVVSRAI